jgi:short-subunit dehydrogenase
MPLESLKGRGAIVTGASRGLGRVIARALAQEGMNLVLAARSPAGLDESARELGALGVRVIGMPTDVTSRDALAALVERTEHELGGVDVLVNNAGVEKPCPFDRLPPADLREMLEVNLIAAMTLAQLVLPRMLERGRGHIVNVASLAGKAGPPLSETYAASKAGLIGFSQSLRASYDGTGVGASAICPGYVRESGMFADRARRDGVRPPRLLGSSPPEKVAQAVVRAIRGDAPEILVTPGPARLLGALTQLFPRLPGWMIRRMRLREMYERSAP